MSSQVHFKNLRVRMYSTPSGQAMTMTTKDPRRIARPTLLSQRKRPRGPEESSSVSSASVSSPLVPVVAMTAGVVAVVAEVVSVVPGGEVVVGVVVVTTGSLAMVKLKLLLPAG